MAVPELKCFQNQYWRDLNGGVFLRVCYSLTNGRRNVGKFLDLPTPPMVTDTANEAEWSLIPAGLSCLGLNCVELDRAVL